MLNRMKAAESSHNKAWSKQANNISQRVTVHIVAAIIIRIKIALGSELLRATTKGESSMHVNATQLRFS